MNIKQKKGISLIVLIITIIVMIILATAIILALNGSGIISKASEAKKSSDEASKKEATMLKYAEYQLGIQTREIDSTTPAREWVKEELKKEGIDTSDIAITDDGEIQVGLTEVAIKFVELGAQIGDVVEGYDLSSNTTTSYTTDGEEHTDPTVSADHVPTSQTIGRASNLVWRYMGVDENGDALIVADSTGNLTNIQLSGKGAVLNGKSTLDTVCNTLYSSDMGVARSIDYEDVTRLLKYNGPQGRYVMQNYEIDEAHFPIDTIEPLTVEELLKKIGGYIDGWSPNGNILSYKSDSIYISKTSEYINANTAIKGLVFQSKEYILATLNKLFYSDGVMAYLSWIFPCVHSYGVGENNVSNALSAYVWSTGKNNGLDDGKSITSAVRPVVILNSHVNVSYNGTTVTISI